MMLRKLKNLIGLGDKTPLYLRVLKERDIEDVMAIEKQVYHYPWNDEVFKGCLHAGYSNWALVKDERFIGYAILSLAAGEAHILNICIDPLFKGQGLGKYFLSEVIEVAETKGADCVKKQALSKLVYARTITQQLRAKKTPLCFL